MFVGDKHVAVTQMTRASSGEVVCVMSPSPVIQALSNGARGKATLRSPSRVHDRIVPYEETELAETRSVEEMLHKVMSDTMKILLLFCIS